MSFYRYLSSLRGPTTYCHGCGFSTKTKVVYERHIKRCVFRKRWLPSSTSPGQSGPSALGSPQSEIPEDVSELSSTCYNAPGRASMKDASEIVGESSLTTGMGDSCKESKVSKDTNGKGLAVNSTKKKERKNPILSGNARKRRYRNYRCKECGFLSNQSREFLCHRRYQHHEKLHIHACDRCDYASKTKHKLLRHQRLIHAHDFGSARGHDLKKGQMQARGQGHKEKVMVCSETEDNNNELKVFNTLPQKKQMPNVSVAEFTHAASNSNSCSRGGTILHSVLSGKVSAANSPVLEALSAWNIPVELSPEANSNCGTPGRVSSTEEECSDACTRPDRQLNADMVDENDQEVANINASATKTRYKMKDTTTAVTIATPEQNDVGTESPVCPKEESVYDFTGENQELRSEEKDTWPIKRDRKRRPHAAVTSEVISGCGGPNVDQSAVERYMKVFPGVGADPVYGCSLCRFTQPSQLKVERHIRHLHLRASVFKCPDCDFVCKRKTEWIVHKVSHSKKTIFACVECGYQTTFYRNYERHRRHHNDKGGLVKCKYCSYRSTGEAAVQRHMTEFHQSETKLREHAEAKALLTGQCADLVPNIFGSKLSSDEEDLTEIKVPFQMSEIPVNPFLKGGSSRRRSVDSASNSSESSRRCDICGFIAKTAPHLVRHLIIHTKVTPFECSQCGLRYKRVPDLNRHIRNKHGESRIKRASSGYRDSNELSPNQGDMSMSNMLLSGAEGKSSLGSDRDIEQDEPLNLSTKKNDDSSHERFDFTESIGTAKVLFKPKSLKCNYCSYHTNRRSDLRRHKLIHSLEKRFKCTLCSKKFKYQGDLNKHMRTIHNIPVGKPRQRHHKHVCNICTFSANSVAELDKHKLLHKAKQPWACLFCSFKCLMRQEMSRHLQQDHPSEVEMYGDLQQLVDQTYCLVSGNCSLSSPTPFFQNSFAEMSEQELDPPSEDTNKSNRYKCPNCTYETESKNKIQTHMEIHRDLKRFMCPECGKRSNWIWDVRKHIRKEHPLSTQEVIQMSEEEALSTRQQYLDSTSSRCRTPKELPPKLVALRRRTSSPRTGSEKEQKPVGIKQEQIDPFNGDTMQSPQSGSEPSPGDVPRPRDKVRPFKCSSCGRRSNWKWDLRKHIRTHCPGAQVIVLDMEEAKATIGEAVLRSPPKATRKVKIPFQKAHNPNVKKLVAEKFRPFKCSACGKRSNWKWDLNKHIRIAHTGENAQLVVLNEKEAKKPFKHIQVKQEKTEEETPEPSTYTNYRPVPKYTPGAKRPSDPISEPISVDPLRLKRFRCSECNYRSNFKGDIKRHIDKKHGGSPDMSVRLMPQREAADTLEYYNTKCAGRRSIGGGGGRSRPKSHSLPAPLSGIDLLNMRSFTPDTSSIKTEDGDLSRPGSASSGGGMSQKRTINTYQCKYCVFWGTSRRSMEDHCRTHSSGDLYRCKLCGEKSDYKNSMFRHLRSRHNTTEFSKNILTTREMFTVLGQREEPPADLDSTQDSVSMDTSADDTPVGFLVPAYKCKVCGPLRTSIHKYSVIRHFRKRHPEMNPSDYDSYIEKYETLKEGLPTSPSPGGGGVSGGGLSQSFEVPRTTVTRKRHHCSICPYRSSKKGLLQLHMSYHKPQPGNNLRCRHCPYYVSLSRMLHSHIRLHLEEQGLLDKPDVQPAKKPATTPIKKFPASVVNVKDKSGRTSLQCEKCPFITFSKNDFIYHKQFHRPIPNAPHKCELCPYWAKERRILNLHKKVHESDYCQKRLALGQGRGKKLAAAGKQLNASGSNNKNQLVSPCKSELSDMSTDDAVEMASIKQQIIASKVKSVAITPMKVKVSPGLMNHSGSDTLSSYVVQKNLMSMGLYKKYYKCRYCPWTNVRSRNLKMHEKMHGVRRGHKGKLFQCRYCDYSAGNKGLLTHHVKVHSAQYRPGQDFVNDVEEDDSLFARSGNDSTTEASDDGEAIREGILSKVDAEETSKRVVHDAEQKLGMDAFPEKSDFYIKYNDTHNKHILERAVMKKWCCEKCPYATMKKSQFERHTQLHGSRQRYTCQYCDYSVPGYHLLLQHEKLHRLPNPNLLCIQSLSNLMRLPEVPADFAAAAGYNLDDSTLDESQNKNMFENSAEFTEPKKLYRCDRCPYSNARRDHILGHLKFHMIRSEFRCPHCDYSVSKSHLLGQHIKIHFTAPGTEMSSELPGTDGEVEWEIPKPMTTTNGGNTAEVAMEMEDAKVIGKVQVYEDENYNTTTKVVDEADEKENHRGNEEEKVKNGDVEKDGSKLTDEMMEDSPDTMWICQYCDRGFHSLQKLQKHENLHLAGMVS